MIDDGAEPSQTKVPKVRIPKSIWQRLCAPCKNAVIIKLLGKSINFHVLHSRLLKEWRTEHEFEEPSFHPATSKAPKTAVWVKFHGVPRTREKFARVCIEVDLSQQLPSSVDLDLEDLPQILIPVEYESLHKICFHYGEFGHTEDSCRYKNPEKLAIFGNPSTQAMIELTQVLKLEMVENNMGFGPWMVQQPVTKAGILAKTVVVTKHDRRCEESNSQQNRFEVFAKVMDKETDLLHALNGLHVLAGESSKVNEVVAPMDVAPSPIPEAYKTTQTQNCSQQTVGPTPPPAPSTMFVKPNAKPSKRKGKTLGPIPKDTKISTHKPYELPPALKKHLPHTTQCCLQSNQPYKAHQAILSCWSLIHPCLHHLCHVLLAPSQSSAQAAVPVSTLSEIVATHPQQITTPSESSLLSQHVGQVHILAVSPTTALPSSVYSQ
ncbi:hypothetical protein SLEP1_g56468 [Rubroshorea leprosula]|uniref:DUF4283 domain-containing protein n=1 Tax=Rubroshorea leprosula TaxID=152421 RepID=A0AAV5MMB0_9ROSI|nr:hypothetical protein SLEP1_g56468 [Rubroshorea leprosula]